MTSRVAVLAPEELEGLVERAVARVLAASPPSPPSDWITAGEAAKILGVSGKTLGTSIPGPRMQTATQSPDSATREAAELLRAIGRPDLAAAIDGGLEPAERQEA